MFWRRPKEGTLTINEAALPRDRAERFEEPLARLLQRERLGDVTGAGTALHATTREVDHVEIEISVNHPERAATLIQEWTDSVRVVRGSRLVIGDLVRELGTLDCVKVYVELSGVPFGDDAVMGTLRRLVEAVSQPCQVRDIQELRDGRLLAHFVMPDGVAGLEDLGAAVAREPHGDLLTLVPRV